MQGFLLGTLGACPSLSPTAISSPPPQVFINFRGEDLRYGFVSHLEEALKRRHINFFIDKHEERGKDLETLFKRIEESSIALAIFSRRYAESGWCLDELVKMMECVEMKRLRVIPIFIKVEPRDVREQKGDFGTRFWKLARSSRGVQIMKWKHALCSVTNKMGLTLGEKRYENDFIEEIVVEIERMLNAKWKKVLYI
ncbi:PREDICTED: disease resistance protein LAZ5-like [Tarenaya hassleriana]|uniref:disease resistance protein LAZ5-like n=1 Tax=Tarenaya hassleriana TaxID=28532 RepID=UPI0008FD5582|nr:PREDICTED: disease resistance protein LAZ5-like [Tarenaya hassleriana]